MNYKNTNKNLVGQPIFKQLIDFIPKGKFDLLVRKYNSDRYYKTFDSWTHLITMLFGVLSRCDSMGEGMRAMTGKLSYFGLDRSPAKSTAGDGLRNRNHVFFKEVYETLLEHFRPFLSVSQMKEPLFSKLLIFDSTTISLFSDVMKGLGRRAKKRRFKSSHDDRRTQ